MVRDYKRTLDRQQWSEQSMKEAVLSVVNGEMGCKKAANKFAVPQTTLERYVKKERENPGCGISKEMGRFKCVFDKNQEKELVEYLVKMEQRLFGLTAKELRSLAFQLALRNDRDNPFNKEEEMAGEDWLKGFMTRHPEISLRKPESTSAARAMGFNKVAVSNFFSLLTDVVQKYQFSPGKMYNVDEVGITVNPKGHSRIVALKGRRQVGTITPAERCETITAEICFSAVGVYMPPMLIFPRKRMRQEFLVGLPPGSWVEVHETGWIQKESFLSWFRNFVAFSGASKESPVLLLLDGHASHTKSIDLIDLAREKGVVLLCFPPHCTHKLQPLDVAFTKPLSKYYEDEVRKWLRSHPGRVVSLFQIASLFGAAYLQAATMLTAINGFRRTGIWPVDVNVFTETDFLPVTTTDIQLGASSSQLPINDGSQPECLSVRDDSVASERSLEALRTLNGAAEPTTTVMAPHAATGTSITTADLSTATSNMAAGTQTPTAATTCFQKLSPECILPVPKVAQGNKRSSRKIGTTATLTLSPYKAKSKESQRKVANKSIEKNRF